MGRAMTDAGVKKLDLSRRVAVVTGAASGIGAASARLLGARGARLVLVDREGIADPPPGALCLRGDVGDADVFGAGRRFARHRPRTDGGPWLALAVIHDHTRECLALVVDTSISGARVARALDAVIRLYGRPKTIVSDNGTELTSRAILRW